MSTSLARQLGQLRTSQGPTQASRDGGVSIASLGPNLLDVQLGGEQLTLLAKEAIRELSYHVPVIQDFKAALFRDDPNDLDPEMNREKDAESDRDRIRDLLFLLTPHMLKQPAQYVLQYLVTRHKIHFEMPEALFFASFPHFEHVIFNRIVDSLPTNPGKPSAEEDYPRWVEHFKHACHPATLTGFQRHLASDAGFFKLMCQLFSQQLIREHVKK